MLRKLIMIKTAAAAAASYLKIDSSSEDHDEEVKKTLQK